jgi:transposase InsO family protein
MIRVEDRRRLSQQIEEAHAAGARLDGACEVAGIDVRTLQRWKASDGLARGDRRPEAERPMPAHALTAEERAQMVQVANEPRFAELPPARIVPMLADEGRYLASESSFHRVLRAHGQTAHRGRAKAPGASRQPRTHVATAPGQVWCWDVTWLPTRVTGRWYYLYLILDLYSRKIVGHEVHEIEDGDLAAHLVKRTALAEGVHAMAQRPVLHGDNGAALKATTVLAMLNWLGIAPSYSRPRVSDDNAFVESLFRTAKYRPGFPVRGFESLQEARLWAASFVHWYNHEHRHSGLRYVAPAQRHVGDDHAILAARHELYVQARDRHPQRWSGATRNWTPIGAVTLNPERDTVIHDAQHRRGSTTNIQIAA